VLRRSRNDSLWKGAGAQLLRFYRSDVCSWVNF
jgi:hypothetical protein